MVDWGDQMRYNIVSIADIHWGAMDPDEMYNNLQYFLDFIKMRGDIDIVVICGDYFDYRLTLNSKAALKALRWFDELYNTCINSGVKRLRMIRGTKEHDNDQLEAIHPRETGEFFKKFYITTTEETLPGLNCIYCPDETINLHEYEKLYMDQMMSIHDIGFFHGNFDIKLPKLVINQNLESEIPSIIYFKDYWSKFINGPMIAGHWHVFTDSDPLIYIGSYDRWIFGEEEDKGFLFTQYNTEDHSYYWKHIVNPFARRYESIIIDNSLCISPDDFANLHNDILDLKKSDSEMKIRVVYQITVDNEESLVNFNEFKNVISSMKNLKIDVKDFVKKRNKEKQKERVAISSGRYSYILNNPYDIKQNIHEFLLRERNIDIPVETIDSIIGKYIPK